MSKIPTERLAVLEKEELTKILKSTEEYATTCGPAQLALARVNAIYRFLDEDAAARRALGGVLVP